MVLILKLHQLRCKNNENYPNRQIEWKRNKFVFLNNNSYLCGT